VTRPIPEVTRVGLFWFEGGDGEGREFNEFFVEYIE
jgi:hypothetical protein